MPSLRIGFLPHAKSSLSRWESSACGWLGLKRYSEQRANLRSFTRQIGR
jgi:hypothetical protein